MPSSSDPKTPNITLLEAAAHLGPCHTGFSATPLPEQMENRLKREEAARKRRFDRIRIHDALTRTQSPSTCDIFHAIPGSPSLRRFWRRRLDAAPVTRRSVTGGWSHKRNAGTARLARLIDKSIYRARYQTPPQPNPTPTWHED